MLYDAVIQKLQELYRLYEDVHALGIEKEKMLLGERDIDALKAVTAKETQLLESVSQVEKKRIALMTGVANLTGKDASTLTVRELAKCVDEETKAALLKASDELSALLEKVKAQNLRNRSILEINMSYTSFMLDALTRVEMGPTNSYGAAGHEEYEAQSRPCFIDSEV